MYFPNLEVQELMFSQVNEMVLEEEEEEKGDFAAARVHMRRAKFYKFRMLQAWDKATPRISNADKSPA